MANGDDLGPLPKVDRNAELQEFSLSAVRLAFPPKIFRVRDERSSDYGVDLSLEVIRQRGATNARAHVQVKSCGHADANQDGSISYSISSSNLNYLLNGPSPLYLLYVHSTRALYFTWALDEQTRLDANNPTWQTQESVVLRFRSSVTDDVVPTIAERVLREARLHRSLDEVLARASANETTTVAVDKATLVLSDPAEIRRTLLAGGFTMIAGGRPAHVLELIQKLNVSDRSLPRIALIEAAAHHRLGRFAMAEACCRNAMLGRSTLSKEDDLFLSQLVLGYALQSGRTTRAAYDAKIRELLENAPVMARAVAYVRTVRDEVVHIFNPDKFRRASERALAIVDQMTVSPTAPLNTKLELRILGLELRGRLALRQSRDFFFKAKTRHDAGVPLSPAILRAADEANILAWVAWTREASLTVGAARSAQNPLLVADALLMRARVTTDHLTELRLRIATGGMAPSDDDQTLVALVGEVDQALELYTAAGSLLGEVRATLLRCDLLALQGKRSACVELASLILPKAEAMEYQGPVAHARTHIEDTWEVLAFEKEIARASEEAGDDERVAYYSDDELRSLAEHTLDSFDLPADRLPYVERDAHAHRALAKERLTWCVHIEQRADERHGRSQRTMFAQDPERWTACTRFGHASAIGTSDWESSLKAFKATYCEECSARQQSPQPQRGAGDG